MGLTLKFRARCKTCYINVWSYSNLYCGPHMRIVRAGTLDERPEWLVPDAHIFTSTKVPWYVIPDGPLAFPEFYDFQKIWPKDKLERLGKLMEKVEAEKQKKEGKN